MQSNNEGVNRVVSSDETYAFLMESNSIQYQIGMQTYKIVFKTEHKNNIQFILNCQSNLYLIFSVSNPLSRLKNFPGFFGFVYF